jgi:hypothetical protein
MNNNYSMASANMFGIGSWLDFADSLTESMTHGVDKAHTMPNPTHIFIIPPHPIAPHHGVDRLTNRELDAHPGNSAKNRILIAKDHKSYILGDRMRSLLLTCVWACALLPFLHGLLPELYLTFSNDAAAFTPNVTPKKTTVKRRKLTPLFAETEHDPDHDHEGTADFEHQGSETAQQLTSTEPQEHRLSL